MDIKTLVAFWARGICWFSFFSLMAYAIQFVSIAMGMPMK